jgi:hypothetical protein
MRLEDLPAKYRAQVLAAVGQAPKAKAASVVGPRARGLGFRCARGPTTLAAQAACVRHLNETGHHRVECILEAP